MKSSQTSGQLIFAIETLTLGYNVWLGMNNLAGAAQIALIAFFLIIVYYMLKNPLDPTEISCARKTGSISHQKLNFCHCYLFYFLSVPDYLHFLQ